MDMVLFSTLRFGASGRHRAGRARRDSIIFFAWAIFFFGSDTGANSRRVILQHTEETAQTKDNSEKSHNSMGGLLEDFASHRRLGAEAISPPIVLISSESGRICLRAAWVKAA